MGVILDLNWVKLGPNDEKIVGWPVGTMYKRVVEDAAEYKAAGFSKVLFPPSYRGAAGIYSVGYDVSDNYNLEETAYGTQAELIAAVKAVHDAGMEAGCDLVLHQMSGFPKQQYTTAKFPKTPACFAKVPGQPEYPGNVEPDSIPDTAGDWADGDLCAYDQPDRYMWNQGIEAATWLVETVGFDFMRIDEAKAMHAPFVHALLTCEALKDKWCFAEYFDGSVSALSHYVNFWIKRRASALDFNLKFALQNMANNASNFWMGSLASAGYALVDPFKAVGYIESHDSDSSPGEQVIWNKPLAYWAALTFPGESMVYYRDWSTDPSCYGLKKPINNAIYCHNNLAQGEFIVRLDTHPQVFAFERQGFGGVPGCVVFLNNDRYSAHTVSVQTNRGSNQRQHEYTGNAGYNADRWTDEKGVLTVTIPENNNGYSALIYSEYL